MPFLAAIPAGIAGAVGAAGGVIGGLAGSKQKASQSSWMDLANAGANEQNAEAIAHGQLGELAGLTARGPGQNDVDASLGATRSLADLLQQYQQSGGLPNQADVSAGSAVADSIFAPRQTGLNQSFIQQNTEAQRLSAQLGRSVDDPILQAKLRTGFMQQQDMLNSEKGAYGGQIAMSLPGQRLNYAQGRADILGNLATQAFQNRSALLGLGSNLQNLDRNFRMQTAQRFQSGENTSGGGLASALSGGLAGLGMGMNIGNTLFGAGGSGNSGFAEQVAGDSYVPGSSASDYGYHPSSAQAMAPWMSAPTRAANAAPTTFNLGAAPTYQPNASYVNGRNPLYS